VDQVSFLVMRSRAVDPALAFDPDFEVEGFRIF
jgi:predicted nucleic acid-binding protein